MKCLVPLAIIVLGFAQQPSKALGGNETPRTDSAQITSQENANQKKGQLTIPTAPVTTNNPTGAATLGNPASLTDKPAVDENPKIQGALALFTGLLVLVGLLQVIAMIWQGCVLRHTLGAIRHQAQEMKRQRILARGQLVAIQEAGAHTEGLARQAVRQTELTQKELELTHRPWIAVDIAPISPLVFDQRGCVMHFNVTMKNVGHSVAKNVSLWTDLAISGIHDPMKVRDELCNIMKRPENENSDYGWLLFPNQQAIEQRPAIKSPADVQKAVEMRLFQGLNAIGLHLVGCVDYPSAFDPKRHHQTRFVYLVGYVDPAKGFAMGAFDPAVKAHYNIILTPTGHGASAD